MTQIVLEFEEYQAIRQALAKSDGALGAIISRPGEKPTFSVQGAKFVRTGVTGASGLLHACYLRALDKECEEELPDVPQDAGTIKLHDEQLTTSLPGGEPRVVADEVQGILLISVNQLLQWIHWREKKYTQQGLYEPAATCRAVEVMLHRAKKRGQ